MTMDVITSAGKDKRPPVAWALETAVLAFDMLL